MTERTRLKPSDLGDEWVVEELLEPSDNTAVVVKHESRERGQLLLYLPRYVDFQISEDGPTSTIVAPLRDDDDPEEVAESL